MAAHHRQWREECLRVDGCGVGLAERGAWLYAVGDGQPFDTETGRPMSEVRALNAVTWYVHVREYMKAKWPGWPRSPDEARSRR